jgi:hypothetical protein
LSAVTKLTVVSFKLKCSCELRKQEDFSLLFVKIINHKKKPP